MPNVFLGLPRGTGRTYSAVAVRESCSSPATKPEKNRGALASVMATASCRELAAEGETVMVMVAPGTKPLRAAAARAADWAVGKSGIHTTPARAAASAARWMCGRPGVPAADVDREGGGHDEGGQGRRQHDQDVAALVPVTQAAGPPPA